MKTTMSKWALIVVALVLSTFSLTMIGIHVADGGAQRAGVLLFVSPKAALPADANIIAPTAIKIPVSGRYTLDVTYKEDLSKKTHSLVTAFIINGKSTEFKSENILIEPIAGIYDIKGYTENGKLTVTSMIPTDEIKKLNGPSLSNVGNPAPKKLAVFLMNYQNTNQPFTNADMNNKIFVNGNFKKFYAENSYGRQSITGDVYGWYTIPRVAGACNTDFVSDVGPFITANSINLSNYTNVMIVSNCPDFTSYGMANTAPQAWTIAGANYTLPVAWVNTSSNKWNAPSDYVYETLPLPFGLTTLDFLLVHEFGHTLGLKHPQGLSCIGTIPTDNCQTVDMGNYYDVMADGKFGLHFNGFEKAKLNWFSTSELKTITTSGTYTLTNLEAPATAGGVRTFKIKPSASSNKTPIWIEYRGGVGFDFGLNTSTNGGIGGGPSYDIRNNQKGLMLYKSGWNTNMFGQLNTPLAYLMYLRNSPNLGSTSNPYEVSMNAPSTWSEPRYGLAITAMPLPTPMSTTISFQLTMNPNFACTELMPKVTGNNFGSATIIPGSTVSFAINLKNNDYLSCPNSSFSYDFQQANGLVLNTPSPSLTNFLSNLAPDDERQFVVSFFVPVGTSAGSYTNYATLTDTGSNLSTTIPLTVTVQ